MNRYRGYILLALVLAVWPFFNGSASGGVMTADRYYTWGIDAEALGIPEGSIITEAVLTIRNISNWDNQLYIHLVDNPPVGFVGNTDHGEGDFFQDFGGLLNPSGVQLVGNDLVITFSQVDDAGSWVRQVYDWPLDFQISDGSVVRYSSALLELIDYAGNGTPFGIGFDGEGNNYAFSDITLEVVVERYEGDASWASLTFTSKGLADLAAYWPMDDNGADKSVADIHGDHAGIANRTTDMMHTAGVIGDALSFNGTTDFIRVPDSVEMSPSEHVSIAGWFYFDDPGQTTGLVWKHSYNYALYTAGGDLRFSVWNPNGIESRSRFSTSILNTGWNFIVGVFDGQKTILYLNGVRIGDAGQAISGGIRNRAGDLYIGWRADGIGTPFKGRIDNLCIVNGVLSLQAIQLMYGEDAGDMVGHWSMDDNAGSTVVSDLSNNGNVGTAARQTAVMSIDGKIDGAFGFNGVNDSIRVADCSLLSPRNKMTVSGWFYFNKADQHTALVWKENYNFALYIVKDAVRFSIWTPTSAESRAWFSTKLLNSGWNFIAGVFDGQRSVLYLNGSEAGVQGAVVSGGIRDRDGDLYIGRRGDGQGECFDGRMDDVRLYNMALSAEDIQGLMQEANGSLVGHWDMDDAEATTLVRDVSGVGGDGVATRTADVLSIQGIRETALAFDGDADYIWVRDSEALSPRQTVTVCGWFRVDNPGENVGLVWKHSYNYALYMVGNTIRFSVWNEASQESRATCSTAALAAGWNFIVGVFDGSRSLIYINGQPAGTSGGIISGGIRDRAGDLYIGCRADGVGDVFFTGGIDDVRIYSEALNASEILELFNL